MELNQIVKQELLENPLLEEVQTEDVSTVESEKSVSDSEITPEAEREIEINEMNNTVDSLDWDDYVENIFNTNFSEYREPREAPPLENTAVRTQSLYNYLLWQLRLADISKKEYEIGCLIIGNIDDNGYLTVSLDDIAKEAGTDAEVVENVLKIIQNFEPTGVGARNVKECIMIQLRSMGKMSPIINDILEDYMYYLEKKDILRLSRVLKVSPREVQDAIKLIQSCDPKPGRQFTYFEPIYIIPDVYVEKVDDTYRVRLNEDVVPRVRINKSYYNLLKSGLAGKDSEKVKNFLKTRLISAKNLIKSLNQRKSTIYRVTECIVEFQKEFLDKGPFYLKPMVLKDVALKLGMHEATIGRTVNDKYVQTPQGLFELRFFFSSGINSSDGNMVSSTAVKEKIKQIIVNEDPKKPYSDAAIKNILAKSGIKIARRTVAKYREEMKIPPATKRKQY